MKYIYLVGSVIFTVIILILAFGNISAQCNGIAIFMTSMPSFSPMLLIFGISALGIVTGACYFGFLSSLFKESDEEEQSGSDW